MKMYTVISKSGWAGDYWRIRRTFSDKKEAITFSQGIKTSDATEDGYNVAIKAHRKPLHQLMTNNAFCFNDGTKAW